MADEVSIAELARRLDRFFEEVRGDFTEVHRKLDAYVLREVHDAQMARQADRIAAVEREAKSESSALRTALDSQRAFMRWLIGGPVFAILALIVQIVLAVRGAR